MGGVAAEAEAAVVVAVVDICVSFEKLQFSCGMES